MSTNESGYLSSKCIENLLRHLKISDYSILPESRVVQVKTRADLMKILINLAPFEGTDEYPRHLDELDDKVQIIIGSWHFETDP